MHNSWCMIRHAETKILHITILHVTFTQFIMHDAQEYKGYLRIDSFMEIIYNNY